MSYPEKTIETEDSELPTPAERVEVLLALALGEKKIAGPCPSTDELSAWYEQRLSGRRKSEVLSHVARCDRCYREWSGMLDATALDEKLYSRAIRKSGNRRTRLTGWFPTWRAGFAGLGLASLCVVALLTLFFIVPRTQWSPYERIEQGYAALLGTGLAAVAREQWVWGSGLQLKGIESESALSSERPDKNGIAQRAFQYGVRVGLQRMADANEFWRGAAGALPLSPEACAGNADVQACEAVNRTFIELGQWAVLVHFACEVTASFSRSSERPDQLPSDFWTRQAGMLAPLDQSVRAALPHSGFARFFTEWRRETGGSVQARAALCSRETALLSLGLR